MRCRSVAGATAFGLAAFLLTAGRAPAEPADAALRYPDSRYIVGIGRVPRTGESLKDRRTAEVHARAELAKQIEVRVRQKTIDVMCEGGRATLLGTGAICRNHIEVVSEESVDLLLVGSRIVETGEKGGEVYAVAILERGKVAGALDEEIREATENVREGLDRAKAGDRSALDGAERAYRKAVTLEVERDLVLGVRERSDAMFGELEREILRQKGQGATVPPGGSPGPQR